MKYNKFRVSPKPERTLDGIVFDSKKEMHRYAELLLLVRSGDVIDMHRQVPFRLEVNGVDCGSWRADFVYQDREGRLVVEDVKGHRTPLYKLKKKLVEAIYDVKIIET